MYTKRFGSSSQGSKNYGSNRSYGSKKPGRSFGGLGRSNYKNYRVKRNNPYRDQVIKHEMYISKATESVYEAVHDKEVAFTDFHLHPKIMQNISRKNYVYPTKIQAQVIKHIMEKKDVVGLASTGSGKTAAFLIPAVNAVLSDNRKRCLIIAPTRELVNQIQVELRQFAAGTFITDVLIVGGASYSTQIRVLRKNPQFVIGTPGRLIDLFEKKFLDLSQFDVVVLDEVDQMLDMGFINDVKLIISKLKQPRQSLFFSATMSPKIREISASLLSNPVTIEVAKQSASKNVDQDVVRTGSRKKIDVLHELLINAEFSRVLIFSRTKRGADELAYALQAKGHKADALHGNKSLNARTKVLSMFRRDEIDILVATDVASRGIDIPDISHVINYDEPATYEDYIHRIGRTGRIGKKGCALTFI